MTFILLLKRHWKMHFAQAMGEYLECTMQTNGFTWQIKSMGYARMKKG